MKVKSSIGRTGPNLMRRGLNILQGSGRMGAAQLEAPGRAPGSGERKALRRRRRHLVVCSSSNWETAAAEEDFDPRAKARNIYPQPWHLLPETKTQPWPLGPTLLPLSTSASSSNLFLCSRGDPRLLPASSRQSHMALPWGKQDPEYTAGFTPQVPKRRGSSTCLKLNASIKSRTSKPTV